MLKKFKGSPVRAQKLITLNLMENLNGDVVRRTIDLRFDVSRRERDEVLRVRSSCDQNAMTGPPEVFDLVSMLIVQEHQFKREEQ